MRLPLPIFLWSVEALVENFRPPDQFKQPYYAVSFDHIQGEGDPISLSIGGEPHDCYLPTQVHTSPPIPVLDKGSPAFKSGWEAIQTLNGSCGLFQDEYWAWTYCHQDRVVQFEPSVDDKGVIWMSPKRLNFVVGRVTDDIPISVEPLVHNDQNVLQVHMRGGDICDITEKPRDIRIYYSCQESAELPLFKKVEETFACSYEVYITTKLLCDIPEFRKPPKVQNYIHCISRNQSNGNSFEESDGTADGYYFDSLLDDDARFEDAVQVEAPEPSIEDSQDQDTSGPDTHYGSGASYIESAQDSGDSGDVSSGEEYSAYSENDAHQDDSSYELEGDAGVYDEGLPLQHHESNLENAHTRHQTEDSHYEHQKDSTESQFAEEDAQSEGDRGFSQNSIQSEDLEEDDRFDDSHGEWQRTHEEL